MGAAARAVLVTALSLACLSAGPASADTAEEVISGEHLQLVSVPSPAMSSLTPGEQATWDVGVSVTTPGDATVDVTVEVLSAPTGTFELQVSRCAERWTAAGCASGAVRLAEAPVTAGASTAVDTTDAGGAPWYRIAVTMITGASSAQATLRLIADGAGEELSTDGGGSPGPLPGTGVSVLGQAGFALAAVAAGLGLAALAQRRGAPWSGRSR